MTLEQLRARLAEAGIHMRAAESKLLLGTYLSCYRPGAGRRLRSVSMKQQHPHSWLVSRYYPEGNVWLHRELIVTREGVGAKPTIHPATIVQARYNGAYEGASWACFPLHPQRLTEAPWRNWDAEEIECQAFWKAAQIQELLIGLGDSPTAAYDNLIDQACARAGVDRAALTKEPT